MKKGDRVRVSEMGRREGMCVRMDSARRGTFVGLERGLYIKILWDGNKCVGTGFHPDYIELDEPVLGQ